MNRQWSEGLAALSADCRRAMTFLYEHLPESDLDCYPFELFRQFADHALMLRRTTSWCAALDREIFDHYVLFPRVNDEDLSVHRQLFYGEIQPRIEKLSSMEERVLEVNRWCHEMASYQSQDDRTVSPLTVYRNGSGRCGEESAFLVAALRSVGIPARQVYAPRWAHCDDNHAWVEVLCDGVWRFLGACEPEPVLDRGWFNSAASRAILVHSRIFGEGRSPLHGEFLCREGGVSWYNQTARYARVQEYTFRALLGGSGDGNAAPAAGAQFQIQVLNEAGFHTIAVLTADERGEARAMLGLGDFYVLATLNGARAEGHCTGRDVILYLMPDKNSDKTADKISEGNSDKTSDKNRNNVSDDVKGDAWKTFEIRAPKSGNLYASVLDDGQRAARAAELRRGTALREARIAGFCDPDRGKSEWTGLPAQDGGKSEGADRFQLNCVKSEWMDLLGMARGNCDVIAVFLKRDDDPRREALLRTLSHKDLRDVTVEILEDHLQNMQKLNDLSDKIDRLDRVDRPDKEDVPEDIYLSYVLCPRIELEPLTPWRGKLRTALTEAERERFRAEPDKLWQYLQRHINTQVQRTYINLVWTPEKAWEAGHCDERSLRLLFVALMRTLGIPARLRSLDRMPEYWRNGAFHPVQAAEVGALHLRYIDGPVPRYRQNWTLSKQTPDGWSLLSLEDICWENGECTVELPAGEYRLITSVRLPNGNQYAAMREIEIRAGEAVDSDLRLRSYSMEEMLDPQELPVIPAVVLKGELSRESVRLADGEPVRNKSCLLDWNEIGKRTFDGKRIDDLRALIDQPTLLFWLAPGAEPTEHVLNELADLHLEPEMQRVKIIFLVEDSDSLRHPTLAGLLEKRRDIHVLLDEWGYGQEITARSLTCDPDSLPLAVVCDGQGRAVYGTDGYRVGLVELLMCMVTYVRSTGDH